ncbi:MAG: RNA methyltransferase [Candidatus Thiodiazotropha sp.]|jgi:tRNA(Leu) C34 or U34 (ribose-2'-O)-methylase TrmL
MSQSKVTIGLVNPKSPINMGAVLRAAGCFQVNSIHYTGERYDRAMRFQTDTKKTALHIPLIGVTSLIENIPESHCLVCVELVEGATPLPEFKHPQNAYYMFGPEDGTLSQTTIDRADAVVYIPTIGCLNLAAAVNIVLYDRLAKSPLNITSNELIRQSRDTNNRVKI